MTRSGLQSCWCSTFAVPSAPRQTQLTRGARRRPHHTSVPCARAGGAAIRRAGVRSRASVRITAAPTANMPGLADSLPEDTINVIVQFLGFHETPRVSLVSKAWQRSPALSAVRERHRRSMEAAPTPPPGPWDVDSEGAREYLSLGVRRRADDDQGLKLCCLSHSYGGAGVSTAFSPTHSRIMLPTTTDQGCTQSFLVEIDKCSGQVLVHEFPKCDGAGREIEYMWKTRISLSEDRTTLLFNPWHHDEGEAQSVQLDELKLLARYEAVGVFIGISTYDITEWMSAERSRDPKFGWSVLLQMPATDATSSYPYVFVGASCTAFATPEPITRFFAHLGPTTGSGWHQETMLSSSNVYFRSKLPGQPEGTYTSLTDTILCVPRAGMLLGGRTNWELANTASIRPDATRTYVPVSVTHPTARWTS